MTTLLPSGNVMVPPDARLIGREAEANLPDTITGTDTFLVGSDALAAVIVCVYGIGTMDGAEYAPVESIVPTVALPPATPLTDHVTDEL
jgi:hypothetical protein